MSERTYDVVAMSFPIVYTIDGDHDPNGMLYTLRTYQPLLTWARDQWEDHDEYLPKVHYRLQLMRLVVDGLRRYQAMRARIAKHRVRYRVLRGRGLLNEVGGRDELLAREEKDAHQPELGPHDRAVRQNYRATVDELVTALGLLTSGKVKQLSTDAALVRRWIDQWQESVRSAEDGIERRLEDLDLSWSSALETLAGRTGLDRQLIRRLLLNDHRDPWDEQTGVARPYDRFSPLKPLPVVRPLVLRACAGEQVHVHLENQIRRRRVGFHLQGDGLAGRDVLGRAGRGVNFGDGAHVGRNDDTTVPFGGRRTYTWDADREGGWAINDLADIRGTEQGTNAHGLFAALIVEPKGCIWRDPESGVRIDNTDHGDGLYVDVIPEAERLRSESEHRSFVDFYLDPAPRSFREFTVFFHDEPEIHSGTHLVGEHTVMPLSYRAEPMPNRLPHRMRRYAEETKRRYEEGPSYTAPASQAFIDHKAVEIELDDELNEIFWVARTSSGEYLERVAGEEQHHSSWLFGEPVTPIFRAYRGDPARIRLIHAGVKETHVFHLHVHQWRAVAQDTAPPSRWQSQDNRGSQLLDSITIGPQTAITIDPLYGSGSRQRAVGDIIWHCHLYPHFHHGMWGLWRSYDRLVDGSRTYPDGTPCEPLEPLPGRKPPASSVATPGFPWFIDATFPRKSPPPPVLREEHLTGRRRLLGMGLASAEELAAFDPGCVKNQRPGALFVDLDGLAKTWNADVQLPEQRIIRYEISVSADPVAYNRAGWHDQRGHHYQITDVQLNTLDVEKGEWSGFKKQNAPTKQIEAFYPRANHGDIVELHFHNDLGSVKADDFDLAVLPVECGLHVHLVKFDVLAADGSSTGWNYLAGASSQEAFGTVSDPQIRKRLRGGPLNVGFHRWVVDEEFGPCFFHDHLLANYRQKHGLFAALIAEPQGSRWFSPDRRTVAWSRPQAVVEPPPGSSLPPYREACLAVGDFIPLYDGKNKPLNTPHELGGDDDPGAMGVNYRSAPLTKRGKDPSEWFSSSRSHLPGNEPAGDDSVAGRPVLQPVESLSPDGYDPDTSIIGTYPGERLRIRLIQGSHEEQHSFVAHGLRWRKDWHNVRSPLVNQQTIGISEAFTLDIDPQGSSPYGFGDHLWQFAAMDDLWLGCWGIVRALQPKDKSALAELPRLPEGGSALVGATGRLASRPLRDGDEWVVLDGPEKKVVPVREYVVVARRIEHQYAAQALTDPWGLIYEVAEGYVEETGPEGADTGNRRATRVHQTGEPLVLRARAGEWVRVTLINEVLLPDPDDVSPSTGLATADPLLPEFGVEPNPPRLPIEHVGELGYPDERTVTPRVSLHPSLLLYDVVSDDGANIGRNHDGTVGSLHVEIKGHDVHTQADSVVVERDDHGIGHRDSNWREYWWLADEALAPDVPGSAPEDGPGQVCYLQDMADVRNHRHHGLIGALIVEPKDCTPVGLDHVTGEPRLSPLTQRPVWWGAQAQILDAEGKAIAQEVVIVLQDGLRQFVAGDHDLPVRDIEPGHDPEDSGQKAINYRTALVSNQDVLHSERPPTPTYTVSTEEKIWVRLVCAADKPRNHTFTIHGVAWKAAPWLSRTPAPSPARPNDPRPNRVQHGPWTGSISGLTAGATHDLVIQVRDQGDHAYRSGVFKWAVSQGMWGILRTEDRPGS